MSFFHWFGYGVVALCLILGLTACEREASSPFSSSSAGNAYVEVTSLESEQKSTESNQSEASAQLLFHKALKATRLVYASEKDNLSCNGAVVTNTAQVRQNQQLNLPCAAEAALSSGISELQYDLREKEGAPLSLPPTSAFGMWLYVEDPQALQEVTLSLYMDENTAGADFQKTASGFHQGWNLIRFAGVRRTSENWTVPTWNQIEQLQLSFSCLKETTVQIGSLWAENPDKATIILIEDGGFESFLEKAYPKLAARSIPVTWAIDVERMGTQQEDPLSARITEKEYEKLAKENGNAMNFHGYSGEVTASMTEEQLLEDNLQSLDYLLSKGWEKELMWRSAYCQNKAQNAQVSQTLFMATATPHAIYDMTVFPFINPFDVPRFALHDLYPARMETCFQLLGRNPRVSFALYPWDQPGCKTGYHPRRFRGFFSPLRPGNAGRVAAMLHLFPNLGGKRHFPYLRRRMGDQIFSANRIFDPLKRRA